MTEHRNFDVDLAYIHDVGYCAFATGVAPGVVERLRRSGISEGLIVDLGCGSGVLAKHLLDHGYSVLGIDISPAMIDLARARAPTADLRQGSWHTAPLPRCRAITALGEVLCYEFESVSSRSALPSFLQRASAALEPGGWLLFDVCAVGLGKSRPPTFREGPDWACLVTSCYDEQEHTLTRKIVSFRRVGEWYRRTEETHRQQLYRATEITALLRAAGFCVRTVGRIGQYPLLPKRIGFLARKP